MLVSQLSIDSGAEEEAGVAVSRSTAYILHTRYLVEIYL